MKILISHVFTIVGFLLAIIFIAKIIRENRSPGSTMAWLMAIVLIPYIGIPFYFLFGGKKTRRMIRKKDSLYPSCVNKDLLAGTGNTDYKNDLERILMRSGSPPATTGNQTEFLSNGKIAYERLMELLEGAKHSIDITTFILGRDRVGETIVETLARKARQGIKVRLILDALGCFRSRGRFVDPIREAGGEVGIFMQMFPMHRKWSANLRNHRKITIVDGSAAIVGGRNLSSEYMGPDSEKSGWYDFNILVKGPLVSDIRHVFNADWDFATGGEYRSHGGISPSPIDLQAADGVKIQVAASGPDVPTDAFADAILSACLEARERVWVITPYFIPDDALLKSLALLSLWQRDVRIIIPARSNHFLADWARGSYLRTLSEAGVKVLFFHGGMLHSKIILIDQAIAIVGSANMDVRSLYLNYEIALFIYSSSQVRSMEEIIENDIISRTKMMGDGPPSFKKEIREWVEDISRVFSPFL